MGLSVGPPVAVVAKIVNEVNQDRVPFKLTIRACASTFLLNSCALKVNNGLTKNMASKKSNCIRSCTVFFISLKNWVTVTNIFKVGFRDEVEEYFVF